MRAYCCKIALISMALLWGSATARAEVVLRDDFDDAAMDTSLWTPSVPVAMEVNEEYGVLRMVAPGGQPAKGNVALNAGLVGDFDIRLNYEMLAYSGDGDARAQLYIRGPSSYVSLYYHRYEASAAEIIFAGTLGGEAQVYAYQQNVPDAGKLCVRREGARLTAYYWSGVRWCVLLSRNGFADEATVKIAASSSSGSPGFVVHFDDVEIKAEAAASPLEFKVQPAGAKRYTNAGALSLGASADGGIGDLRYRWVFAGEDEAVVVGEGTTYTIEAPTVAHSGEYWCEASDRVGTAMSAKATVRFAEPLQFTAQPEGGSRYTNDGPVGMTVAVSGGMDVPAFRWMFDAGDGAVEVGTGASHTIEAPTPAHSGAYWCEATDAIGTLKSATAQLTVAGHMTFTTQPAGIRQYADTAPFTLTASPSGGLGAVTCRWMFDDGSEPKLVGEGNTLTVEAPTVALSGAYWCQAVDEHETVLSDKADVLIADHLLFAAHPRSVRQYVDAGPATLSAIASGGLGAVTYRWMKADASDAKAVGEGPSFVVETPTPPHSGTYWCEAADELERVRSNTAGLLVAEHLSLTTHPRSAQRKAADGPHEWTVTASGGLPPLVYRWMFNNGDEPACASTGNTLKIAEPVPAHSGVYWCEVSDMNETVRSNTASLLVAP